jgi:hypothetical protein
MISGLPGWLLVVELAEYKDCLQCCWASSSIYSRNLNSEFLS